MRSVVCVVPTKHVLVYMDFLPLSASSQRSEVTGMVLVFSVFLQIEHSVGFSQYHCCSGHENVKFFPICGPAHNFGCLSEIVCYDYRVGNMIRQ